MNREQMVANDTKIAELHDQQAKLIQRMAFTVARIYDYAGYRKDVRTNSWNGTFDEAVTKLNHGIANGKPWLADVLDEHDRLGRELAAVMTEIAALHDVWQQNGCWSRFFLVLNNNGHVHSSMSCTTTYPTTQWGWLPQLSGLTEADAVADQGEILCSVCFPSAPVAWTSGTSKASQQAKADRDAARAARMAKKAAKALFAESPDIYLTVGSDRWPERLSTIAAAKSWLTDAFEWGVGHPSYSQDDVDAVANTLAHRLDTTPESEIEAAQQRARKRR